MARTIQCPADQWTVIFNHGFVQLPYSWRISFVTLDGGEVAGEVEEKKSSWIFPNPPTSRPLLPTMSFERGWFNTFYSVRVKPARDTVAQIR